ncbi:hypothetical protein Y1Q_0003798 [Alligator mississippiensis]|uniref:Uncharacterized protein n=1 Tax=Alligator mississippiensis TaxID=8496 RepID=A0A151MNC9_ALLMI|nr:hypothetical protein Y1Q_0003798 [Alligator mississippiensis]
MFFPLALCFLYRPSKEEIGLKVGDLFLAKRASGCLGGFMRKIEKHRCLSAHPVKQHTQFHPPGPEVKEMQKQKIKWEAPGVKSLSFLGTIQMKSIK